MLKDSLEQSATDKMMHKYREGGGINIVETTMMIRSYLIKSKNLNCQISFISHFLSYCSLKHGFKLEYFYYNTQTYPHLLHFI